MVEVQIAPNLKRCYNLNNEKEMETTFSDQLKKHGWIVHRQVYTDEGKRVDVLAHHYTCPDEYFIFELKYLNKFHEYTSALKQILDKYYNKKLVFKGISTSLVALITPFSLYRGSRRDFSLEPDRVAMIIERFYWRMGFGIGNLENFSVIFTSQGSDTRIKFSQPNGSRSLSEKIRLIKQRQHWEIKD